MWGVGGMGGVTVGKLSGKCSPAVTGALRLDLTFGHLGSERQKLSGETIRKKTNKTSWRSTPTLSCRCTCDKIIFGDFL